MKKPTVVQVILEEKDHKELKLKAIDIKSNVSKIIRGLVAKFLNK